MNFGCWGTGLGHDKAIRRSADRGQNQAVLRAGTVNHRRSLFLQKKQSIHYRILCMVRVSLKDLAKPSKINGLQAASKVLLS